MKASSRTTITTIRPVLDIDALRHVDSEAVVCKRLREMASGYGTVKGVSALPGLLLDDGRQDAFLVDFVNTEDAEAAARDLNCYLYGFTTVVVLIPPRIPGPTQQHALFSPVGPESAETAGHLPHH